MITPSLRGLSAEIGDNGGEIRVYNDYDLPLEPSTLYSMSEYNLSLCLFSTLFVLDDASVPTSEILEKWPYVEKFSAYDLTIKKDIVWSDGRPFLAHDIKTSILRLKTVAPTHHKSITSLFFDSAGNTLRDEAAMEIISDRILRIHVGRPSSDLFARLSAAFIPMIRSDLVDPKTLRVARHDVSLGPYIVNTAASSREQLHLIANPRYYKSNEKMARSIKMRPYGTANPRAEDIIKSGFWPNLMLDRVFTTKEGWSKLEAAKASMWTRPIDRVLYIYPSKRGVARGIASTLQWLGSALAQNPIDHHAFPGIHPARSLQPKGFFLFKEIHYPAGQKPDPGRIFKMAILNPQIPGEFLKAKFNQLGLNVDYDILPISKGKEAQNSDHYDLIVATFGAADPDPVTWLSLVLSGNREFIADYDMKYRHKFEEIKEVRDIATRISRLRELITRAGEEGLYVPIAHFSSIAVADHTLNLSQIRPSDETVDLSKVIVNHR